MIIKTKEIFDEKKHDSYLSVNLTDNYLLNITYGFKQDNNFNILTKSIKLDDIFEPVIPYSIYILNNKTNISDPLHVNLTKDFSMSFYRYAYDLNEILLNIYFDKTIDDILIISRIPYSGDCEIHTYQKALDCILDEYPNYRYRYHKKVLKNKLLANIDWGESLTSNEAQLDYLTLIIKTILDSDSNLKSEVLKKLEGVDDFFEICNTENVLAVKPENKLFLDISAQKDLVRKEQSKYWEELEKIRNEI